MSKVLFLFLFYFCVQFCSIAKNGDHPHEDLAIFGYKLHMNVIFLNKSFFLGEGKVG
jgi:hypothetical protein